MFAMVLSIALSSLTLETLIRISNNLPIAMIMGHFVARCVRARNDIDKPYYLLLVFPPSRAPLVY